ncbi:hypothetical protein RZS08_55975, partial [Arthrospira platensis SPKY1]|nr:hypothetical protein [Arthrospira platensis SPKY1]
MQQALKPSPFKLAQIEKDIQETKGMAVNGKMVKALVGVKYSSGQDMGRVLVCIDINKNFHRQIVLIRYELGRLIVCKLLGGRFSDGNPFLRPPDER